MTNEIVERAKAGDQAAVAELYQQHHSYVRACILRRTGNRWLAEDLAQEVWVRALPKLSSWQWQGVSVRAWLVTIAHNLVADHFKKAATRLRATGPVDRPDLDPLVDPERAYGRLELSHVLAEELTALTDAQRQVLWLRFWACRSVRETAAHMGLEEGAAKALQYRATQRLAGLLPAGYRRSA